MKYTTTVYWFALTFIFISPLPAQDFRVSQYQAMPLLVNPAQTGDYIGTSFRVQALYARVYNDSASNRFQNISLDNHFGKHNLWAFGINYSRSGSASFPMSGNYWGFSLAKGIFLDKQGVHQLRAGIQASYLQGSYDASKGVYNRLLDASVLKYYPAHLPADFIKSAEYWNLSVGLKYKLTTERVQFETGISAYNVTNPRGWNFMPGSGFRKRYRMSILSTFTYVLNNRNSVRLEQYSWKEGLYLRNYTPGLDDSTEIDEAMYGLTWIKTNEKHPWSFGLHSRAWKSAYGILDVNITPAIGLALSYEIPIHKSYYGISHFELSASLVPYGKRGRKKLQPVPEDMTGRRIVGLLKTDTLRTVIIDTIRTVITGDSSRLKDSDGDGVLDYADKCPNVYGSVYNAGCPLNERPLVNTSQWFGSVIDSVKNSVYFDYNSSDLNNNGIAVVDKLVSFLKENTRYKVSLLGLASFEGGLEYNMKLSRRRAIAVTSYLMSFGIDEYRIVMDYAGNRFAKIISGDRESRWPDRKVIVYLKSQNE